MRLGIVTVAVGFAAYLIVIEPVEAPDELEGRRGCPSIDWHRYDGVPLIHITSSGAITYRGEPTTFAAITRALEAESDPRRVAIIMAHASTDASLVSFATRATKNASYDVLYAMREPTRL